MYFWQIETEIPVATNQSPFAASEAFPPFSGHGACMPPPPTQNPPHSRNTNPNIKPFFT